MFFFLKQILVFLTKRIGMLPMLRGDKLKFPRCRELISLQYSHDAECVRNQTSVCPWEFSTLLHLNLTGLVLFTYCKHLFGICFTTQQGVISESEKLSSYNRLISERWLWWAVKGKWISWEPLFSGRPCVILWELQFGGLFNWLFSLH